MRVRFGGLKILAIVATLSACAASGAQTPFQVVDEQPEAGAPRVGGRTSIDLIRLDGGLPTVPLRNSGVIPGSEQIWLDGVPLRRGEDYELDAAAGVVYLMRPFRAGQSLRASYRFDPARRPAQSTEASGFLGGVNQVRLNFAPGSSLVFGLGVAERQRDGSVAMSNVYGLRNAFSFGQGGSAGGLKGLYVVSDRRQVQARSLLEASRGAGQSDEGQQRAIVQELTAGAFGGRLTATYQDVSDKFTGLQAFRDAGYDGGFVDQLGKERGLRRVGFQLTDAGGPGLRFSNAFRTVEDGDRSIEWRSMGMQAGGLRVGYQSHRVDRDFRRFDDLAEGDREQLKREAGMAREAIDATFDQGGVKSGFRQTKVDDGEGREIHRRSFELGAGRVRLAFADQHVEQGFNRFGSLREGDREQLARESGLRRESYGLEYAQGGGLAPWRLATSRLRSDAGDFVATDLSLSGKNWSFELLRRDVQSGMDRMSAMSEPEIQGHIGAIRRMYELADFATNPNERGAFLRASGLEREGVRLSWNLGRGSSLMADQLRLSGATDSGTVRRFALTTPRIQATYRQQRFGEGLTEIGTLMEFERARLGTIAGLNKTDMAVNLQLGGARRATFAQMTAETPAGDASRMSVAYEDKGISFSHVQRDVAPGFGNVNQLVDPERELLHTLVGFRGAETRLNWDVMRGLRVDLHWSDYRNAALEQERRFRRTLANWRVDKDTQITYLRLDQRNDDPLQLLFENSSELLTLHRKFSWGEVLYERERRDFAGAQASQPDADRETMRVKAQLGPKSAIEAGQTQTQFSDGVRETIRHQTLSTEVNERTGVSVSDVRVERSGEAPDEQRRNYGFWWDFGKGMRFTYGYARNVRQGADGTRQEGISITPGQVGGVRVDQFGYNEQAWDRQRFLNTGNVQISSVRPFRLGFLTDVNFRFGADTVRDRGVWQRENRYAAIGSRIGSNSLSFEYLSQMHPTGVRAIDRTYRIATDQSENRPLRASFSHKVRTLPNDQEVMIRSYNFVARPWKGVELTHSLVTNPDVARGDAILGSVPQPLRTNRWKLDFNSVRTQVGVVWDEIINDQTRQTSRTAGVNLRLNADNPSPIELFYGLEQGDVAGRRRTMHRYHLRFDQRPGPNQMLSLFVGNVSYQHSRPERQGVHNWTLRLEYQLRF
jgi:hypothetical protein